MQFLNYFIWCHQYQYSILQKILSLHLCITHFVLFSTFINIFITIHITSNTSIICRYIYVCLGASTYPLRWVPPGITLCLTMECLKAPDRIKGLNKEACSLLVTCLCWLSWWICCESCATVSAPSCWSESNMRMCSACSVSRSSLTRLQAFYAGGGEGEKANQ